MLKNQLLTLWGVPVHYFFFSLAAFNIFSLYLIFDSYINTCLGVFLFGFILYGTLCASWTWLTVYFPMLGKFLSIISSNIFSDPFFFSSSSGTPIIQMLVHLMLSQRFLSLSSILFILFSLFCSLAVISTILSFRPLISSSASVIQLLIPSRVFIFYIYSSFLLGTNFIHITVYMSIPIVQFITSPPPPPRGFPPLLSIHLFSTSVSQFLPWKPVHLYHFSRFHIYVLIYDICFSLSDLLHFVWQSLDPSTSQQMTQFCFFLWLSNIPLYICTIPSLSIRLLMGI